MKVIVTLALGFFFVLPSNVKAQSTDLNSNSHAPTLNNGMKDAMPTPTATQPPLSGVSESSGTNDGPYVASTFVTYEEALKAGKTQKADLSRPKTLAEIAAEAKAKKAEPKEKLVIVEDANGNLAAKPKK